MLNQTIESEEKITLSEMMLTVDKIIESVALFWSRSKIDPMTVLGQSEKKKVDDLSMKLYNRLKEEYPKFHTAYSLLLFNFVRGIYDRDTVLVYFDDIARNGLGDDANQITQLARYTAHATAAVAKRSGHRVKKSDIRKHKKAIIESMTKERQTFKDAVTEIKKRREEEATNNGNNVEDLSKVYRKKDEAIVSEAFNIFSSGTPMQTNDLFKKSVEARKQNI